MTIVVRDVVYHYNHCFDDVRLLKYSSLTQRSDTDRLAICSTAISKKNKRNRRLRVYREFWLRVRENNFVKT